MTHWFCRSQRTGMTVALVVLTSLAGCTPTPLTLVSAVDLVLTATEDEAPEASGPISIETLLANARDADRQDAALALPTATLERGPNGIDGTGYIALGTFLSALNPAETHTVTITRGSAEKTDPFADAQFAVLVGQLIKRAGHAVALEVSPAQARGSLHLSVQREDAA